MRKEEIITYLKENDSTVLSFPNRNNSWGSEKWRGNCSGWIIAFLVWKYNVQKMAELFAGSGTGSDVCKDMGIPYIGADLNPNPVRNDIICCNAITDDVPEEFLDADFLFMHPPYSSLCNISWAGKNYPDPTGELRKADLGNMGWDNFIREMNKITMKFYAAMQNGGRIGMLVGDVRRNGHFYSMLTDLVKPGELEQIIVKVQHNTVSQRANTVYAHKNFVPIAHEFLLVFKKTSPYMIDFQLPVKRQIDIRDSKTATWRDVVIAAFRKIGKSATLFQIYSEIEGHEKCKSNENWKAKVRQVLQVSGLFENIDYGEWKMIA